VLRTDASDWGCGAVLFQITKPADGTPGIWQIVALTSHKFSKQALQWPTIEKEGFGMFKGVKDLDFLLSVKSFALQVDHNNLLWMEASTVPKIIRWRIFLQAYDFVLSHVPGKQNIVADWLSRIFTPEDAPKNCTEDAETYLHYLLNTQHPQQPAQPAQPAPARTP
jgi:hypothetical protein